MILGVVNFGIGRSLNLELTPDGRSLVTRAEVCDH